MTTPPYSSFPARIAALIGHIGLMLWVVVWQSWLSPHPHLNSTVMTLLWVAPLLIPLHGIVKGKPYTHAWANFILMIYFLHGLTLVVLDEGERLLAVCELLLTSLSFVANIFYARLRGRELSLKLPRLSQVEKEEAQRFATEDKSGI
ncbi:DUF2069 domain-containing protein [Vibrio sp. SM6]|uniref:DUF2069 domain-containing protein n=1 Tax=Vibrio agarilyticus TaxID=2726741 RepID=A0A7X8TR19_9VIBR|nr:DUF2069 domain-containing protein [Vibrio agarilyticus]NLS13189.1 DUF2069 domain-containing protein [Vibrio agarilyticus]